MSRRDLSADIMTTDPREGSLPKWTQALIIDLRRKARDAAEQELRARLATGPDDARSNTLLDAYNAHPIRLGLDESVRFVLPESGDPESARRSWGRWIEVRVQGDAVYLSGNNILSIMPRASNACLITDVPR